MTDTEITTGELAQAVRHLAEDHRGLGLEKAGVEFTNGKRPGMRMARPEKLRPHAKKLAPELAPDMPGRRAIRG
jgi:hypothetical protein